MHREIDAITIAFLDSRGAVVTAAHHIKRLGRLDLEPSSPGCQWVAEGRRRVEKDPQRNEVKGHRCKCLEVLRGGEFFTVNAVDGQAPEADAQPIVKERLRI